ncbi:MAG: SpoIID/LytB domain-containing protein [bacterium]
MSIKRIKKLKKQPLVKLKIGSGKNYIDFKTTGIISIADHNGKIIEDNIKTDIKWHLKVEHFKNEKNSYSFLVNAFKNKYLAVKTLNKLKKSSYNVRLEKIGDTVIIGNKEFETTFFRVLLGEFNCKEDALNSKYYKMLACKPFVICEKIRKPKAIFELCDENINRIYKIEDSIKIISKNRNKNTNTTIYNVLNNENRNNRREMKINGNVEFKIDINKTINVLKEIPLEKYLKNIIYHELGTDFHLETLKSQTVISRGNILLKMQLLKDEDYIFSDSNYLKFNNISRDGKKKIEQAVNDTRGEVILYNDNLYRMPFCKSCGGYINNEYLFYKDFSPSYLKEGLDNDKHYTPKRYSLKSKSEIKKWIGSTPDVLCNPKNLNSKNFFLEYKNYFRWKVTIPRMDIGYDIGFLFDIIPQKRNKSGRVTEIEILGSKNNIKFNNEYDICGILSNHKIPSNCFVIEKEDGKYGIPSKFIFRGAGKGRGIGLCQSGAEVLAKNNKSYNQILKKYFNNSVIHKIY